jgi:SAM-dependent methyltransferase
VDPRSADRYNPAVGVYARYIFPRLLDFAMGREVHARQRPIVLAAAAGRVLEIGFGTGRNLPYYPADVKRLTIIEPNAGMAPIARRRIAASRIAVEPVALVNGRDLPLADGSFDTVVSTWTLCSIADVAHALAEIRRVLAPGGEFLFIEHGRSPEPRVALWQDRLNPINCVIGVGCNLNRPIDELIVASGLELERCERFYLEGIPKIGGFTYRGAARAVAASR